MKPNIFLLADWIELGPEDALTAYWHYLLSVVPGLGQAFVDEICRLSGLPGSTFVDATDHPAGDESNRPDFLLKCQDYSILFEHKLNSPLGDRQLQRYLELAARQDWKLALLAANPMSVDEDIKASERYIRPTDTARPPHFLWQDMHDLLRNRDHHLVQEFREYLELRGLGRFSWAEVGDPFTDDEAGQALLRLYDCVRLICDGPGVSCRRSGNSLIYQVRTPFPPVHLLNLGPMKSAADLRGPVMALWVWIRRTDRTKRMLADRGGSLASSIGSIAIRDYEGDDLPYDRDVVCERSYYIPLESVLRGSLKDSEANLSEFVRTVVTHLRAEVATLVHSTSIAELSSVAESPGALPLIRPDVVGRG